MIGPNPLRRLRGRTAPASAASLPDGTLPGSPAVTVAPGHLRLDGAGAQVCASFAVVGYPAEVAPGWLDPLLTYPGRLDVSLFVEPVPAEVAAGRLRQRLARLEAATRADAAKGRLEDFTASTAAADATELAARLARGQSRLQRLALYLTVHAADEPELRAEVRQVRAICASLLLDLAPATYRQLHGWITTSLPLGTDALRMRRTVDTEAITATYPFSSPDLTIPLGPTTVVLGTGTHSSGVVAWDRFSPMLDNHNVVILARSGSGKSYLAKLELLRSLFAGIECLVIDPESEYDRLTQAVGGAHIELGKPGVHLNPLQLPRHADQTGGDALTRKALFLHTFLGVLLGELDAEQRAALDTAIITCFNNAGITSDPRTWRRPAPLLTDLAETLRAAAGDAGAGLAARLAPYTSGSYAGVWNQPTSVAAEGHLVTFSLRHLPEELRSAGLLLALDAIWGRVTNTAERRPRLVVIDEGWQLLGDPTAARYVWRLAKTARKWWCGLTVITQDAADLLSTDLGRAVASNAATQLLLRQAPQVIDQVAEAFQLSAGERALLASARRGEALLTSGSHRAAFTALASPEEDELITTDPAQLADLDDTTPNDQEEIPVDPGDGPAPGSVFDRSGWAGGRS